jgi:transposase-like protein
MKENGGSPGPAEAERSAVARGQDAEVVDKPMRRRFSAAYKQRIVAEADQCTEPGEVGRLLRREGLYSSSLTAWRKAARDGSMKALSKKRGRKPERNPLAEKAHLTLDVQRKVAGLLGITFEDEKNSCGGPVSWPHTLGSNPVVCAPLGLALDVLPSPEANDRASAASPNACVLEHTVNREVLVHPRLQNLR